MRLCQRYINLYQFFHLSSDDDRRTRRLASICGAFYHGKFNANFRTIDFRSYVKKKLWPYLFHPIFYFKILNWELRFRRKNREKLKLETKIIRLFRSDLS